MKTNAFDCAKRPCPVAVAAAAVVALALGFSSAEEVTEMVPPFDAPKNGLVKHTGTYPALDVEWTSVDDVESANAVFPHPVVSERAVVATVDGLQITEDQGLSWQVLPRGSVGALGEIQSITYDRIAPETFYVASGTRGIWKTSDNGKTFSQIGSKATGMASDNALRIVLDNGNRILLALHGDETPGISRTVDGGRTWDVIHSDYYVSQVFSAAYTGQDVFIAGAPVSAPDSACLYIAPSLMEPWQELGRDLLCTGFTGPKINSGWVLVSTANRGIFRVTRNGGTFRNIAPVGVSEWFGIGATWDATADSQIVYAFEPKRLGLVLLDPSGKADDAEEGGEEKPVADIAYETASRGLLTCPVVREGAHIRANANGQVYYACINSLLYRGERVGGDTAVRSVRLSRPVCAYDPLADKRAIGEVNDGLNRFLNSPEGVAAAAISLKQILSAHDAFLNGRLVTVSAVIDNDAAGLPPRQVTVDLSRIGLSCRTPLAPAGNGVYEATFAVDPANIRQIEKDWRQIQPIGLTVTAVSEAGGLSSGIGALAVANTATRAQYHNGDSPRKVESGNVKFIGNESKVYRTGRKIMGTQVVEPGPWQVSYQSGWGRQTMDISSFQVVALWIRASRESTEDIVLELQDDPTFGTPSTTPGLPLIAGGFVPGGKFTEEFKQIVIPVSKLIGGSETFHPSILRCLLISGKAGAPIDYYIDKIVLYDSAEAAVSDVEGQ